MDDIAYLSIRLRLLKLTEDMHTNIDTEVQRTGSYDAVANNVHTRLVEREANGSESNEATSKDV